MSQFIFEFINQNYLVNRCTRFETRFHLIESHRNYEYYSLSRVFPGIIAKYNNPDSKRIFPGFLQAVLGVLQVAPR